MLWLLLVFVWDPKELSVGAKNSHEVSEEDKEESGNVKEAGEEGWELSRVGITISESEVEHG